MTFLSCLPKLCVAFYEGEFMKRQLALAAALLIPTLVSAADELKAYKGSTELGLIDCRSTFLLAQAKGKYAAVTGRAADTTVDSDVGQCIERHTVKSKEKLVPALDTLKTDDAKKTLKAYHVAFVTALRGIDPGSAERQLSYDQRQQALRDKVNEAWAAFELEQ